MVQRGIGRTGEVEKEKSIPYSVLDQSAMFFISLWFYVIHEDFVHVV